MSDDDAEQLLLEVRNLHSEITVGPDSGFCVECGKSWPCPTVRLVEFPVSAVSP